MVWPICHGPWGGGDIEAVDVLLYGHDEEDGGEGNEEKEDREEGVVTSRSVILVPTLRIIQRGARPRDRAMAFFRIRVKREAMKKMLKTLRQNGMMFCP
ncbi:hypothetical protein BH09VER1_BH09VER1_54650 [soil metagenome]